MSARIKSAVVAVAVAAVFAALAWNRIDVSPDFGASRGLTDDMLARAMEGDAPARYDVALAYLGTGEAGSDRAMALHWFTLAADRGHARAQSALGHLWIAGGSVQLAAQAEGDTRAPARWVELPAERLEADLPELGEDANPTIGVDWLRKAALQGELDAMERLALALERGEAAEPDALQAARWYRKPGQAGSLRAQYRLALLYDGVALGERDAAEAATWYRLASEQGHAPSQARLATLYTLGDGVHPRYDEAARWARASADQGNANGCYALAVLYLKGFGVEQNFQRALRWYRKAATGGHAAAQNMLGTVYLAGEGVPIDAGEAERWWQMAADQGYAPAQFNLGGMFSRDLSADLEREDAMRWLAAAASQGHRRASVELAALEAPPELEPLGAPATAADPMPGADGELPDMPEGLEPTPDGALAGLVL